MKRIAALTAALALGLSGTALADPAFGPGASQGNNAGPQDGKCHPPGQIVDRPECK